MAEKTYTVGRGKPPKASQFKKGQSGNPKGRPRAKPKLIDLVEIEMDKTIIVTEGGKKKVMTLRQVQAKRVASELARADMRTLIWYTQQLEKSEAMQPSEPLPPVEFTMKMEDI